MLLEIVVVVSVLNAKTVRFSAMLKDNAGKCGRKVQRKIKQDKLVRQTQLMLLQMFVGLYEKTLFSEAIGEKRGVDESSWYPEVFCASNGIDSFSIWHRWKYKPAISLCAEQEAEARTSKCKPSEKCCIRCSPGCDKGATESTNRWDYVQFLGKRRQTLILRIYSLLYK